VGSKASIYEHYYDKTTKYIATTNIMKCSRDYINKLLTQSRSFYGLIGRESCVYLKISWTGTIFSFDAYNIVPLKAMSHLLIQYFKIMK